MAAPPQNMLTSPGFITNEKTPDREALYMTPEQMLQEWGMQVTEHQIRFAMTLINTYVCRPSLWPEQFQERKDIASDRNQIILAARPILELIAAAGRYGYGRRDATTLNQVNYDYLAAISVFGSPPRFTEINVDQIEFYGASGETWLPTGFFLINYTQIQIIYLTGFTVMPARVKAALAEIVNNICSKGVSDRVQLGTGQTRRVFANEGFLTRTACDLLDPFVVRSLM